MSRLVRRLWLALFGAMVITLISMSVVAQGVPATQPAPALADNPGDLAALVAQAAQAKQWAMFALAGVLAAVWVARHLLVKRWAVLGTPKAGAVMVLATAACTYLVDALRAGKALDAGTIATAVFAGATAFLALWPTSTPAVTPAAPSGVTQAQSEK